MAVLGSIGVFSSQQRFAWRGMSSADYDLRSSLHRSLGTRAAESTLRQAELKILADARDWGLGVRETGHVDDLQLLADLQHYGIPTRLIDFTSNPMTALWFACQTPSDPNVARSGILLALDVGKWPIYSSMGASTPTYESVGDPGGYALKSALKTHQPFVVECAVPNDRLRAQEGFFVAGRLRPPGRRVAYFRRGPFKSLAIDAVDGDPEELETKLLAERGRGRPTALPYIAVIIRAGLKHKLLGYLESTYNRQPRVLFPDYTGFRLYGDAPKPVRPISKTQPR